MMPQPSAQDFPRLSVQFERLSVLAAYDFFGRRNPYFFMR